MCIVLLYPNYHSGGAEIAGNWPPAWVAYIAGQLKVAGYRDLRFNDAMTDHMENDALVKKVLPSAVTVLGDIHGTFMCGQVLSEAPWIDDIIRGEGEEIAVNFITALDKGRLPAERETIRGLAFLKDGRPFATPAHPPVADLDSLTPAWSALNNSRRIYLKKATWGNLWDRDAYRRRYLRGCLKAYLKSAMERRFYDLGRINDWGQGSVDFGFDESKLTSKEELVRMRSKKEIQHVRREAMAGVGNGSSHPALPIIEMSGHDLPADEFIAPKRSTLTPKEPPGGGGVRAC